MISYDLKPGSVAQTLAMFDHVVEQVESHNFQIKERPVKLCKNCDMQPYCDRL